MREYEYIMQTLQTSRDKSTRKRIPGYQKLAFQVQQRLDHAYDEETASPTLYGVVSLLCSHTRVILDIMFFQTSTYMPRLIPGSIQSSTRDIQVTPCYLGFLVVRELLADIQAPIIFVDRFFCDEGEYPRIPADGKETNHSRLSPEHILRIRSSTTRGTSRSPAMALLRNS